MKSCAELTSELGELALGGSPSERARLHLLGCDACASELERLSVLARRIDLAVNALVHEQPSAPVHERVAARLRTSSRRRPWKRWWPALVAGVALATGAAVMTLSLRAASPPDTTALAAWRSPTATLLERK